MIVTKEWIPLNKALERLKLAADNDRAVDVAACSELLEALAIPPNKEHGFPQCLIVRQTWVVSCENLLRPVEVHIPDWRGICMPLEGWAAWRKLAHRYVSFEAWALSHCIQERFACIPAGRSVHLLDPRWRPSNASHPSCGAKSQGILLAKDELIATCTECKATTVEKALK